jgi:hypothetical protein
MLCMLFFKSGPCGFVARLVVLTLSTAEVGGLFLRFERVGLVGLEGGFVDRLCGVNGESSAAQSSQAHTRPNYPSVHLGESGRERHGGEVDGGPGTCAQKGPNTVVVKERVLSEEVLTETGFFEDPGVHFMGEPHVVEVLLDNGARDEFSEGLSRCGRCTDEQPLGHRGLGQLDGEQNLIWGLHKRKSGGRPDHDGRRWIQQASGLVREARLGRSEGRIRTDNVWNGGDHVTDSSDYIRIRVDRGRGNNSVCRSDDAGAGAEVAFAFALAIALGGRVGVGCDRSGGKDGRCSIGNGLERD